MSSTPYSGSDPNRFDGVKHVVQLESNRGKKCEHCSAAVGMNPEQNLATSINHYVGDHGYRLLHIGTESAADDHGHAYHWTVAFLGK